MDENVTTLPEQLGVEVPAEESQAPSEDVRTLQPPGDEQFTAEEVKEAKAVAKQLMTGNADVNYAAQNLLIFRQGYSMARVVLQGHLVKAVPDPRIRACVEEALVQAMAAQADKPFDSNQLLDRFKGVTLPWMVTENNELNVRQQKADREEQVTSESRRRAQPIPIGFEHSPDESLLSRDKSLCLFGHEKAIGFVMGKIATAAMAKPETQNQHAVVVIQLVIDLLPQNLGSKELQHARVGQNSWLNTLDSYRKFDKEMQLWLRRMRGNRVDLLLVPDITQLSTGMTPTVPEATMAARVHKVLRQWANDHGAALVVGVSSGLCSAPFNPSFDETLEGWRTLHDRTIFRTIDVSPGLGSESLINYRLLIDNRQAFTVDKAIIDGR